MLQCLRRVSPTGSSWCSRRRASTLRSSQHTQPEVRPPQQQPSRVFPSHEDCRLGIGVYLHYRPDADADTLAVLMRRLASLVLWDCSCLCTNIVCFARLFMSCIWPLCLHIILSTCPRISAHYICYYARIQYLLSIGFVTVLN